MKRLITISAMLLVMAGQGMGATVELNATNFTDATFLAWVKSNCDTDKDGKLSDAELAAVTKMNVMSMGIGSLKGIEYFTSLQELYCNMNDLTTLDLSGNTELLTLSCSNNELESLNISKCTKLESLICSFTNLNNLNVTNNTKLRTLTCVSNPNLSRLDVTKNTGLVKLQCYNCSLTSLDLSNNKGLYELMCYKNKIQSITVANEYRCLYTARIDLNEMRGEAMDNFVNNMPQAPALFTPILCVVNSNESYSTGNKLSNEQYNILAGKGWAVRKYDESTSSYVTFNGTDPGTPIDEYRFPDANFRSFVKSNLDTDGDGHLDNIEKAITKLNVYNRQIADLKGIEHFTNLQELSCHVNRLETVDLSKNTMLTKLDVSNNQLIDLDLSQNTRLQALYCNGNQLTTLDLSQNKKLWIVNISNNQIHDWRMDYFVEHLPHINPVDGENGEVLTASLYALNYESPTGNAMTKEQVINAGAKAWTVYSYVDYGGEYGQWEEYEGEDPQGVVINAANFPDPVFRNYLLGQYFGEDGVITPTEMAAINSLILPGGELANLKGVEFFTDLERLDCSGGKLTTIDVSKNKKLSRLTIHNNNINGADMDKLLMSLPDRSNLGGGTLFAVDLYHGREHNDITKTQVTYAKKKGWNVMAWNYDNYSEDVVAKSYAGSGDAPIDSPIGDVNCDGAVDVADIASVISAMSGDASVSLIKADVNEDGAVDVADISTIIDIMAGKFVAVTANAYCPNESHPHWIDMGLPSGTKWRCCNEGASKPEDYGGYYTFEEAQAFNAPTKDQFDELQNKCTSEWTKLNYVNGRKFTGPNGRFIFLPAAGYFEKGELTNVGYYTSYWSSTPVAADQGYAADFNFGMDSMSCYFHDYPNTKVVRPVR